MKSKPDTATLVLLGASHHRTPIELRERLYLSPPEAASFARRLTDGGGEAIVLSTCNRTEVYLAHSEPKAAAARAHAALARRARLPRSGLEALREVNERLEQATLSEPTKMLTLLCECGEVDCTQGCGASPDDL
jgi:glutamyl-tRNA reductase